MTFMSLLAALLLEQLRPLPDRVRVGRPLRSGFDFIEHHLNAGEHHHGVTAWLLTVLPLVALSWVIYYALDQVSFVLAWAWNVLILYLTMGFRQFSHHFTDIHRALAAGDLPQARALMGAWRGRSADELNSTEIARLAIEEALMASHHHVFGVLFWFAVLPGPAGALLYRLTLSLKAQWGATAAVGGATGRSRGLSAGNMSGADAAGSAGSPRSTGAADRANLGFGHFARQAARWIDWVPLRLTAIGFAVVGNFEDAVYCWRNQAARWRDPELGIVLASGAGAIGVTLGKPLRDGIGQAGVAIDDRIEIGSGLEADAAFLSSTVGLVWRALVLWMLLLAMLAVASWV